MEFLSTLPGWAVFLLGLFAAAVLVMLNIGWLLQAKAMLDGYVRKPGEAPRRPPTTERPEDGRRSSGGGGQRPTRGGGSEGA